MFSFSDNKMSASALLILSFAHQAQAYYQRSYTSSVNTCYSDTECHSDTSGWTIGFVVFVAVKINEDVTRRKEAAAAAAQAAAPSESTPLTVASNK